MTDAGGLAATIDRAFPAVFGRLAQAGVERAGPPFIRYLATGERLELELGVPVPAAAVAIQHSGESAWPDFGHPRY